MGHPASGPKAVLLSSATRGDYPAQRFPKTFRESLEDFRRSLLDSDFPGHRGHGGVMSEVPRAGKAALPLRVAKRLDQVCDRFERAWRAGQQPRITDYLILVQGSGRQCKHARGREPERAGPPGGARPTAGKPASGQQWKNSKKISSVVLDLAKIG
jgi:hypothetical protein